MLNLLLDRWIDRIAERVLAGMRPAADPVVRVIGNSNLGYRRIGDLLTFYAATSLQTGAANDADAAPTYVVYEEENATEIVTSTSMALLDSAATNGLYSEQITLAEATGYEFQKDYAIYITATISSIASHALYTFRIGPEGAVLSANAQAGAAGTVTLHSGASATDDLYNGMRVVIIGGTGAGQARTITDYVGSTKVATIEPNWITNPSSSSIFAVYDQGRVAVHTGGITSASFAAGAIDAAAIATDAIDADAIAANAIDASAIADGAIDAGAIANGAIDAATFAAGAIDAAAIADGAIDAATFAAGAITASAIATDAIGSDELAASAVTEIQAGLATSAAVAAIQADTDDIQTRLPATLVGGRMRSHVEAMDAGVITSTVIATDAIGSDEIAASAVTEIQAGLATAAALALVQADTDDIQARLPATLVGGRMRSHVEAMDAGTITAAVIATGAIDADALASDAADEIIAAVSGTADSGSTTTLVDAARTEADDDYWTGSILLITSGSTAGQLRRITDFDAATDTITVDPAFTQAISTNTYLILRTAIGTAGSTGTSPWDEMRAAHTTLGTFGEYVFADTIRISDDAVAADRLETMLDGTGGNKLTLEQLRVDSSSPGGGIDIDNSAGPAVSNRSASGTAVENVSTAGNGHGVLNQGQGSGSGVRNSAGTTGHGVLDFGGATSGDGHRSQAQANGHGHQGIGGGTAGNSGMVGQSGVSGHGFYGFGDGPGDGMRLEGGATGHGHNAIGGATSGDGFHGSATVGDGMELVGAGGGFDLNADIQGSLSGSVGSVTGSVGSVAAGGITAASIATDAIDADALAADAVAEIQLGLATSAAVAAIQADTDDIQTRLPATLNGGRMRSHVEAMDAGTITAAVIATGAIDADALAEDACVEIISAFSGTADSGSTTTLVDAALTQADTDYWAGSLLYIRSGTTAGQIRRITAFNAGTDTLTVDPAFTQAIGTNDYSILRTAIGTAAASGSTDWTAGERDQIRQALGVTGSVAPTTGTGTLEVAIAGVQSDTDDIQTRLPASLSAGRMRSQVEGIDAGAITAAAIATDAIDADALAADAVAEIQSGLATAAAVAAIQADTDDIQTRLPASLSGGRMRSQVEGMDAGVITAAAIATDAIDSDAIAPSAVTEIQAGLATAAAVAAVQADTDDIQTRLPASLSGGRMRSQVEGMDAGTITAAATDATFTQETEDTVWDASLAAHLNVGSTGEALSDAAAGSGGTDWTVPERDQIRQALGVTGAVAATTGSGTLEVAAAAIQADTDDIQTRLPATLNAGRMRSHVEACDPPCTPSGGGGGSGDCPELEMLPG